MQCFASRDVKSMERLLAADIEATSDGGGEFYAAKVPVVGRQKVALFFSNVGPSAAEADVTVRTLALPR